MSSFDFENEVLDTSWIDEEDRIMNTEFNTLNKENINKMNIYFFYINKDNCVDKIDTDVFIFDGAASTTGSHQSVIETNKLLKIIQDKKTIIKDGIKKDYSLVDILSFQVNLENENLQNYNDTFPKFDDNNDLQDYVKRELSGGGGDDDDDDDDGRGDDSDDDDGDDEKIKITDKEFLNQQYERLDGDDADDDDNKSEDTITQRQKKIQYYKDNYLNYDSGTDSDEYENSAENFNDDYNISSSLSASSFSYFKHDLTKYDSAYSNFFKKHSYFDNILIEPAIFIFHSLTSLFFMFKERTRTKQKLPPLRSILKKYNKTHKNVVDETLEKHSLNKTKKNVSIVLPHEDNKQNINSGGGGGGGGTNNVTKKKYNSADLEDDSASITDDDDDESDADIFN